VRPVGVSERLLGLSVSLPLLPVDVDLLVPFQVLLPREPLRAQGATGEQTNIYFEEKQAGKDRIKHGPHITSSLV